MTESRCSFAIAFSISAVLGCSRGDAAPRAAEGTVDRGGSGAAAAPLDASVAGDAGERVASGVDAGDPLAPYATAAPIGGKSVGHTSVVFKLKLAGDLAAAYKPRSTRGHERYKGEIAAYRLARALGIDNVPPAGPRSFDGDALARAVGSEPVFGEVVRDPDGQVRGALIPWIKNLEFLPLERESEIAQWTGWLRAGGAIPDDQRAIAAQIATVLAFDMVTGNWDRWSGGNVGFDRARNELLFVDNDGAFFDPVPVKEMRRGADLFGRIDRFPRSFVQALRGVDVKSALGEQSPGVPLLSARQVAQADMRRKSVLAAIDAKIAKLGEAEVLTFP